MGNVLYELHMKFEPALIGPFVMVIFIAFFPKLCEKLAKIKGEDYTEERRTILRVVCVGVGCFASLIGIIALVGQAHMYHTVMEKYRNGTYQVVEGYVEDFEPMPYEGHKHESFRIKDVYFEYSDDNIQSGYHNTKSHGGVIRGNGQYLKVGYVYYNSAYGNIIVYIEE
jgi:hypothetical protein